MSTLSRYNFVTTAKDRNYVYNSRTGSIVEIDAELATGIRAEDAELVAARDITGVLAENGILIAPGVDERSFVDQKITSARERNNFSHIVITPTLSCNFQCPYCFQNEYREKTRMSRKTYDLISSLLLYRAEKGQKSNVTWFGGEPLSCIADMKEFYLRLVDMGLSGAIAEHRVITNGSLLTPRTVAVLKELKINHVQVSIDSRDYQYGLKRGVFDEDGNQSPIIANVARAVDEGLNIQIRINVSKTTEVALQEIVGALTEWGLGDRYYLARVEDSKEEERSRQTGNPAKEIVSRRKFAEHELNRVLKPELVPYLLRQLTPKSHFCGATDGTMLVVAPDGSLSRCWISAGNSKETLGQLGPDTLESLMHVSASSWDDYRASNYSECRSCKVMPLCLGGCSHPRTMEDILSPPCTPIKFNVQPILDYVMKTASFIASP